VYQADDDEEVLLHKMFAAMDEKVAREDGRCTCDTCTSQWRIREGYESGKTTSAEAVNAMMMVAAMRKREQERMN